MVEVYVDAVVKRESENWERDFSADITTPKLLALPTARRRAWAMPEATGS